MRTPRPLDQHTLELNTDVAEWCPHPAAQHVLAVGCYELDDASQRRLGALHLFRLQRGDPAGPRLALAGSLAGLPGVFDLRWRPRPAMPQLAAALADGSVRVLSFGQEALASVGEGEPSPLQPEAQAESTGVGGLGMAVSLDYTRCSAHAGEQLVASYSSGQLQLFQVAPTGLASLAAWQAHELEAWAAATDHWHPSVVHSGGDDCAYRVWDSRQGFQAPAWQSSRAHGAGVCCVASSPHQEHAACTGSYDDRLRLWDLRSPQRPLVQAELNMGGGVWRAKWHPADPQLLLTACMYNGFAVVRVDGAAKELSVEATYEHEAGALSYGADWCWQEGAAAAVAGDEGGGGGAAAAGLAATCDFYGKRLHLWEVASA